MDESTSIPWFGARRLARELAQDLAEARARLADLGGLSLYELDQRKISLEAARAEAAREHERQRAAHQQELQTLHEQIRAAREAVVATEEVAQLQQVGVYQYFHPLAHAVALEAELATIQAEIKAMCRKDGGAVMSRQSWTVNGSEAEGRRMLREYSSLMLRAFNAEADSLVVSLKPHRCHAAVDRLQKTAAIIAKLGRTMGIQISEPYFQLRVRELRLTSDYLEKKAGEKEGERLERERLREERKVQQELERERERLIKERQHYANALAKLAANNDAAGSARMQQQLEDVEKAIADVDYREANIRAGYVYMISNIGSFGERLVKVGLTRRLDPLDRIRELSDASVPFNFDVHALFFSKDAVAIEAALHSRLAEQRVNLVNRRREFFQVSAAEVKVHLAELAGELLEFTDVPEALEYRQGLQLRPRTHTSTAHVSGGAVSGSSNGAPN